MASGAEMQGTMDGSVDKIEIKAKRGRTLKEAVYGSL
jgi:hypothetical protein